MKRHRPQAASLDSDRAWISAFAGMTGYARASLRGNNGYGAVFVYQNLGTLVSSLVIISRTAGWPLLVASTPLRIAVAIRSGVSTFSA